MIESPRARPLHASPGLVLAGLAALSVVLAGCAQEPASTGQRGRSSEYFPSSKYGPASARVVSEGQPVPRGGGQRLVGRPYTVAGKRYVPRQVNPGYMVTGVASWYGAAFHGRRTANGEVYDMRALSAAHPTMPLPSYARVTNLRNGHSIIVRVNDRGPFHAGRVLDVSQKVAETLDFRRTGTGRVKVDYIGPAGLAGSDDNVLMASLRTDGRPATLDRPTSTPATMIAQSPAQPGQDQALSGQSIVAASHAGRPDAGPQTVGSIGGAPGSRPEAQTTVVAASTAPQGRASFGSRSSTSVAQNAPATEAFVASAAFPAYAPLPPPRPFDLATIPGADTPIAANRRRLQPTFFAEPSPLASTLIMRRPFDGVSLDGLQPLR